MKIHVTGPRGMVGNAILRQLAAPSHQTLLPMASTVVEEVQVKSQLLGSSEIQNLQENEVPVQTIFLREYVPQRHRTRLGRGVRAVMPFDL